MEGGFSLTYRTLHMYLIFTWTKAILDSLPWQASMNQTRIVMRNATLSARIIMILLHLNV